MFSFLNLSSLLSRGLVIHILAYSTLVLCIFFLRNSINDLEAEATKLKADLAVEKLATQNAFLIIDNQNSKIEQLKIDSEKLSLNNSSLSQELNKRFGKIKLPNNSDYCEKLKFYDNLLLEFNNDYYKK
ncbi:hypothetical protein [Campylobacter concisus]|jgi:hypothetical protein|uniref:hypothetical protein n=1 Tax=Campylobacter concisus TaxID=199 RepID=UPI000CD9C907|nr:hypothetical protein [Campylobacter concisus]DAI10152.1 MAG TPA: hypothetical protein [Caudoviricetes sp.]